jgi:hypothetical protein
VGLSTANSAAMETSVYIPLANLAETTRFELSPQAAPSAGVAGYLIEVVAYIGDALQPAFNLTPSSEQPPAAVVMRYADADIAGMDENALRLFQRSGAEWVDATCAGYGIQRLPQENRILIPVCQTGTFALAVQPPGPAGGHTLYLPVVIH